MTMTDPDLAPISASSGAKPRFYRQWMALRVWGRFVRRSIARRLPLDEAQEVRRVLEAESRITERYLLMCALSSGIATLGMLQSSTAVVIGAMLISPLMSPIAALGIAFASFDGKRLRHEGMVLGTGVAIGVLIALLVTWLSPIRNPTPELIARTAPTLLDLAVALFSGLAGGYAAVHQRGETAIGVAIATALMPPLATVGYGLAVFKLDFAGGAALLFLTNLAAISFSFALITRLRGVARPLSKVKFTKGYGVLAAFAVLLLAAPLALTLYRVTQEAVASAETRKAINQLYGIGEAQVSNMTVSWENFQPPEISATVIVPAFRAKATDNIEVALTKALRVKPNLSFRQIVAADPVSRTQALVDAAFVLRQGEAGASQNSSAAPIEAMRRAVQFQVQSAWANPIEKTIILRPEPSPDWTAQDYKAEEQRIETLGLGWDAHIIPPAQASHFIGFANDASQLDDDSTAQLELAKWVLERLAPRQVDVVGVSGNIPPSTDVLTNLAQARARTALDFLLRQEGEALPASGWQARAATAADISEIRTKLSVSEPLVGVVIIPRWRPQPRAAVKEEFAPSLPK